MSETPEKLGWWNAFVIALGIPVKIQAVLIRAAWVVVVTGHIAWACGWLVFLGLPAPWARADALDALRHTQEVTAQITIANELRTMIRTRCKTTDPGTREGLDRYIESLQVEYQSLTRQRYPEGCQ